MKRLIVLTLLITIMIGCNLNPSIESSEESQIIFSVLTNVRTMDEEGNIYIYCPKNEKVSKSINYETSSLAFNPNENKIVTTKTDPPGEKGAPQDIMKINLETKEKTLLTDNGLSKRPVWSQKDNLIYYTSSKYSQGEKIINNQIFVMNYDGSKRRKITDINESIVFISVSPDESQIVFDTLDHGKIGLFNIYNFILTYLTSDEKRSYRPKWSPVDEDEILFLERKDNYKNDIYIMDREGDNKRQVTKEKDVKMATWSPNGDKIAFIANDENRTEQLYVINKDGTGLRKMELPFDENYSFTGLDW